MPHPIFTGNPQASQALADAYKAYRWRTPFVTQRRLTKAEAHALAFAQLRARMQR